MPFLIYHRIIIALISRATHIAVPRVKAHPLQQNLNPLPHKTQPKLTPPSLLQAGASKVFISSRKSSACDSACKTLNALPGINPTTQRAISVPSDSATLEGIQHLVAEVSKQTPHVDILLANAGASWGEKFDTHPDSAFAKVMDLNVRGVFNLIREFAPLLQKRATLEDPSRVVITASVAGLGIGTLGNQGTYGNYLLFLHMSFRDT